MKTLRTLLFSGREVLPIIEGGKGLSVSNGQSAGAFAAAGCIGTFSGVNADAFDGHGRVIPQIYLGRTRRERYEELIAYGIQGGIAQARVAHEASNGRGRIHMNVLWEAAATQRVLHGILEGAKGLIHGITCGAGMPYKLAEIASRFSVSSYPIVSSARAFRALWKRAYHRFRGALGGVVYEDPWLAGGHNGLSNSEDSSKPEAPFPRVLELRQEMRSFGLHDVPIIMAGGVWYLREWSDWIDHPDLGPIAFQFGTRPLLTKESPVSDAWKQRLLKLESGDVSLNRFSPTGFYSSAVKNAFLTELIDRNERQIAYSRESVGEHTVVLAIGVRGRIVYVTPADWKRAQGWIAAGFGEALRTPDSTIIFVSRSRAEQIRADQQACMGCLSACRFSNWAETTEGSTGKPADPRSYCIQKTLQAIAHDGDVDNNLMFAGHNVYRFASDPFYSNGFIPTVKQLVDRILTGD
jgi:NAD(P)H-dependent flavin oxidoreductase YrpB (nitropropane dioxygenase family)